MTSAASAVPGASEARGAEAPDIAAALDDASLTVAAVARRLGVAPGTLRTWARRYGLEPSGRSGGAHRRYTPEDVARLEHMRRLVIAGVTPVDAARAALAWQLNGAMTSLPSAADAGSGASSDPSGDASTASRAGGGRVIAMPGGAPSSRGLARAAQSLDSQACTELIAASIHRRGVVWTWDELICPVLAGVGQQWEATGTWIEVEHVLSDAVIGALREAASRRSPAARHIRPVLLAAADKEAHDLPLWATAAALAERGVPARMLGANLPFAALARAIERIGPAAVLIWSQSADTGQVAQLDSLPSLRPVVPVFVGGPGWLGELPADVERVDSLPEAVAALSRAAGE